MNNDIRKQKNIRLIILLSAIAALLTVFVIISIIALSGASQAFDDGIYLRLIELRNTPLNRFLFIIGFAGNAVVLVIAALAFELFPKTRHRVGFKAALAVGLSPIVNIILKNIFQRPRPFDQLTTGTGTSFPSGHAFSSASFFVTVILFLLLNVKDKRILIPAVAACVLAPVIVSFCRVFLGAHWTTDTMAGMTLGTTMALTVHFFVWPLIKKLFRIITLKWSRLDIIYRFVFGAEEEEAIGEFISPDTKCG